MRSVATLLSCNLPETMGYGSKNDKLQACFLININLLIMYCNFCNGVFINISGETNFIDERKANDIVAKTIIEKRGTQSY